MTERDNEIDRNSAAESLDAITQARRSSAKLAVKAPWWYAPAIYLGIGYIVALPAIPDVGMYKHIPASILLILIFFRRNIKGTEPATEYVRDARAKLLVITATLGFLSLYVGGWLARDLIGLAYAPFITGTIAALLCWWLDVKEANVYLQRYGEGDQ